MKLHVPVMGCQPNTESLFLETMNDPQQVSDTDYLTYALEQLPVSAIFGGVCIVSSSHHIFKTSYLYCYIWEKFKLFNMQYDDVQKIRSAWILCYKKKLISCCRLNPEFQKYPNCQVVYLSAMHLTVN